KLAGRTLLTQTGTTLGTVAYMSPEQATGGEVDYRTDIWSLGVILYEMVAGERPFKGDYEQAVIYSLLNAEPEFLTNHRPEIPSELEKVIEKALEKDPQRRYASAGELAEDLEGVLTRLGSGGDAELLRIPRMGRRQKRRAAWAAGIVAGVVLLAAIFMLRDEAKSPDTFTIAVLPMSLESGDDADEWLSSGMTDALITDLAQLENLRVISSRSTMRYRNSDRSVPEIARELKVSYVVDGSVRKTGDQVQVSARLVDGASDQYVWADRFESSFSEVLDTQALIAQAIAEKIHGAVTPNDQARLSKRRTIDPETYEAYLKGMHHLGKYTPEDIKKGLAYLHEAVEKNPGDAQAWAGLALGYVTVGHGPSPTPDVRQRAKAAATRAITLDSTLAEAQAAYAIVKDYYDWDWDAAERAFKRSIELNPSLAMSHYHYAWMLVMFDRMDEAIAEHELAVELDPLFPPQVAWMGDIYRMAGRYEEALREADKALELGDKSGIAYLVRGNVFAEQGDLEVAVVEHERMVEANPAWKGFLGASYAKAGRIQDAMRIAKEIESAPTSMDAFQLAFLYAELGNADEAFRWVDYEPSHAFLPWLATRWAPLYSLSGDPRYEVFLERLGLPQHRASEGKPVAQGPNVLPPSMTHD
ncbi:MAG TPA: tetratricopeptide repeat protein, partial [Rhodothermales bacterium]|nr:tetratricopeptide repeat protein [Rhodothermales bacterium]